MDNSAYCLGDERNGEKRESLGERCKEMFRGLYHEEGEGERLTTGVSVRAGDIASDAAVRTYKLHEISESIEFQPVVFVYD